MIYKVPFRYLRFSFLCVVTSGGIFHHSASSMDAPECLKALNKATQSQVQLHLKAELSPSVSKKIRQNLALIFHTSDPKVLDDIQFRILHQMRTSLQHRPPALLQSDYQSTGEALQGLEYMFYVDQFGTPGTQSDGTFQDALKGLDHIKNLGADTVYALPFLESPWKDGGFDVSDFRKVLDRLGGNAAFENFIRESHRRDLKVKMDLILNHVSEEHPWFRKLLAGDLRYKDYFVTRESPPVILDRYTDDRGQIVKYLEKDAQGHSVEIERRLIFPDISNSHYREIEVPLPNGKKKKLWVYHTFFPFQLDLNYSNPQVLEEALDVVSFWANKGVDIFRLDAIPFLDKSAENHPRTHALIEVMSAYLKQVAPRSRLMVEANQKPADMIKYLGKAEKVDNRFIGKKISGTSEASMGYNFGEIPYWASLLEGDKKYILEAMQDLSQLHIPQGASWATFLRVHDELTLEMVSPEVRKSINEKLLQPGLERGLPFREGFGVSGRMAPFLANDPAHIRVAHSLLTGRPGQPVIFFGDEIGIGNNLSYMTQQGLQRKDFMKRNGISYNAPTGSAKKYFESHKIPIDAPLDTRDANRGPIARQQFEAIHDPQNQGGSKRIYEDLRTMIQARKDHPAITRGQQQILTSDRKEVFSYMMSDAQESLLMVNNLSGKPLSTQLDWKKSKTVLPPRGTLKDALTGREVPYVIDGTWMSLSLPQYESLWLVIPRNP